MKVIHIVGLSFLLLASFSCQNDSSSDPIAKTDRMHCFLLEMKIVTLDMWWNVEADPAELLGSAVDNVPEEFFDEASSLSVESAYLLRAKPNRESLLKIAADATTRIEPDAWVGWKRDVSTMITQGTPDRLRQDIRDALDELLAEEPHASCPP